MFGRPNIATLHVLSKAFSAPDRAPDFRLIPDLTMAMD
jgi:hypothetical protein